MNNIQYSENKNREEEGFETLYTRQSESVPLVFATAR